jgi:hypothetical protein
MMFDGLDSPTQDLRRVPLPADTRTTAEKPARRGADPEERVQRSGRRYTALGAILLLGSVAVAAASASADPDLASWPDGVLILSAAALAACMLTGAALFVAGLIERLARHDRAQTQQAIEEQARAGWERAADRREVQDALQSITQAIEKIAEAVPIELDQRWFQGYGRGAEDDLTGTGTDGPIPIGRRRPRAR